MIVLGIDYQRTHSVVCLREGHSPRWPPVSVGDGRRPLIANAVAGNSWAGDALAYPEVQRHWAGAALTSAAWTDTPGAPEYWAGLGRRVRQFLGDQGEVRRAAVVLPAGDRAGAERIREFAGGVGLADPVCLLSGRAALAAALYGGDWREPAQVALFVVVGDCQTEVFAYRVEWTEGRPSVVAAVRPVIIPRTGAALWRREIIHAVRQRCPAETADTRWDAVLCPAAVEFGLRLVAAEEDDQVLEWTGPLRERMLAPPHFSRDECRLWDSVVWLRQALPVALRHVAAAIGAGSPPAMFLAGPGATWPFAAGAAADIGRLSTLDAPELTLARGAAWWLDFTEPLLPAGLDDEQAPQSVESLRGEAAPVTPEFPDFVEEAPPHCDTSDEEWALLRKYREDDDAST